MIAVEKLLKLYSAVILIYITKLNVTSFRFIICYDFGALMLSMISNSEKKKVPDIRAIVTLLLLISHQTFHSYLSEVQCIIG